MAGVFLGGIYADLDAPFWAIWLFAAIVAVVLGAAVTYWRRRFGHDDA